MTLSISATANTLLPVVKAISPKLRRLYQERKAGSMPIGSTTDLLEEGMDKTLDRLTGGKNIDKWWKRFLNKIGHDYISPEFLRIQAVKDWLSFPQVQKDIKVLAREQIMGGEDYDQDIFQRLRKTYADKTGEDERLANGPIDVIVAIIAAGYFGILSPETTQLAGMVQDHDKESKKAHQELRNGQVSIAQELRKLGADRYVVEAHTRLCKQKLKRLLKSRSFEPARTSEQIIALTNRVIEGDLVYTDISTKAEVVYWAARLHASKNEKLTQSKEYLKKLKEIDSDKNTQIIDALILETEGDNDGALRALRDIDTPDGRSNFFAACKRINGNDKSLLWFGEQPNNDNPNFFMGIGWADLAITLAETGNWTKAETHLSAAHNYWGEWPDLAFIEGVVNSALLLPTELRRYALEMGVFNQAIRPIEGGEADKYRNQAKDCFYKAYELFSEIDQNGRAQAALDWHLWLRLTDPKIEISQSARKEISESMKEGPKAVDSIIFARTFEIDFDEIPLKKYLTQRKRTGGLENKELVAEFFLAELKMSPRERVDYLLNEEERLTKVVSSSALSGLLIESLIEDGQTKRARETLEDRKNFLIEHDFQRLETMIDTKDGTDPRYKLEGLYSETGSIIDLKNLVSHLKRIGDLNSLQPRLEELFERERTSANAYILAQCFRGNVRVDLNHILKFFDEIEDLVDGNDDLLSEKAWVLSQTGRLKEAQKINSGLLKIRDNEDDLYLEINIALQLGDWDRFSTIVADAMKRKDRLKPDMLIRLASLSSEVDSDSNRAMEIAKMAVDKGGEDPQILAEAYLLAVQLGIETQETGGWFGRAIELSSDEGPFKKVDIRTVAEEIMPAHREKSIEIEQAVLRGDISLQAASYNSGQLLSRILVQLPKTNTELQDNRKGSVLPIRSGSRSIVEMKSEWNVCLDYTSIMVLNHIDMLKEIVNAFRQIVLDPDTMVFFLNERRRARFHQPFRVKKAENFRSLIARNLIKISSLASNPSNDLINEVGKDFAELLAEAKATGGLVIKPFPIHKTRSFLEQEAKLGEYADFVISTKALVKILHERKGVITAEVFERANQYLNVQDQGGGPDEDQVVIDCPLYLDELSITYLQHTDVFNIVCNSELDIYVHPSAITYNEAIIEESRGGNELADTINHIRLILCKAIEEGKAKFLQRPRWGEKDENFKFFCQVAPTLANIMEDTADCDAVCIDDRFTNKLVSIPDKKGRVIPTVCVIDLLNHLEKRDAITKNQLHIYFQKLRKAGFVFIPILPDELEKIIDSSSFTENGTLIETAEMRLMRQSLMRIRGLDMISLPEESMFLQQVQLASAMVIRRIWSNESMVPEKARELSNWTWRNIVPSPLDWVKDLWEPENKEIARERFSQHYNFLLKPMTISEKRYDSYLDWIEDDVFAPLLLANTDLIDSLAAFVGKDIELMIEDVMNDATNKTNDS